MRVLVLFALLGAAAGLSATGSAGKLYQQAQAAEKNGDFLQAWLLCSQAATLDPTQPFYYRRSQTLRAKAEALGKLPAPPVNQPVPTAAPEPEDRITLAELAEARRPQPPLELHGGEARKPLDFRGDARSVFEQVARTYGLSAVFDADYQAGSGFRFRLDDADYRLALRALEAATASFIVPLGDRLFLVAKDTPQKRTELEPTVSVTVPIPNPVTAQEAQELARAIQQTLGLQRFAVDSVRRLVLIRDRVSKVRPAQQLFTQFLGRGAQVMIEVQFLETADSSSLSYGTSLQTMFPVAYFGTAFHSLRSIPSGFTKFLAWGGGKGLYGLGVAEASALASMSRSSAQLLLHTELRSLDGQAATLHVGDKYPIVTAGFFGQIQSGQFSFPPSFNFEDLGLSLKVTPHVHGLDGVTLDVEAEFKVLTGQSFDNIPVVSNRKVQSQVRLREGQWAVVAGLMTASEARSITGPAGLSHLPVVGALLSKNTRDSSEGRALLILKPVLLTVPPVEQTTEPVRIGSENRPLTPL